MGDGAAYKIFLSYRRADSGGYAGWLHQLLVDHFAEGHIFRDVDSLRGGERWSDKLDQTLARCDVVLAMIGPGWLMAANERGRRLDDPDDRVRLELEAGVRRGVPLIPALVGGASMPPKDQLPESLQPLCDWQAVRLSDESWRTDLENLIGAIERALQATPGELQLGATFGNHEIEALVGRGGMGVVYRGRHQGLDRVDAIKVIAPHLAREPGFRKRFVAESRIAASLRHQNVLTVYDAGEQDGLLYLSMQLVEGSDLATLLKEQGQLAPRRAAEILVPVAEALQAAHEHGLVHRDVKPANILIETHAGREHVFLGDFGLARETTTATGLTSSGHWIGTADYVSPEQVMGEEVDARADVYALGCVLFELLCGRVPYPARSETAKLVAHATKDPPSLAELRPELPEALASVVRTAMARAPDQRYASASDLREALVEAVEPKRARIAAPRRRRPAEPAPVEPAVAVTAGAVTEAPPKTAETQAETAGAVSNEAAPRRAAEAGAAQPIPRQAPKPVRHKITRQREPAVKRAQPETVPESKTPTTSGDRFERSASTVPSRRSTGPPAAAGALPTWLGRHATIAAGVALAVVAGAAFAIGHSGTRHGGSPSGREAKAGSVSLTVPASWRTATLPSVPGLAFANGVAMEEPRSGGVLLTGLVPGAGGDLLLPSAFVSGLPHAPSASDSVRLGNGAAHRYRNLSVKSLGRPFTLLVAPTTAGVAGIGCLAPATGGAGFMASCERAAGTLHLDGAKALSLGPDATYGRALASVVASLNGAQSTARALATARTRSGQALLCGKLAQRYTAAAQTLAAAKPGPDAASVNARLVAALRGAAGGYRDMSRAAAAGRTAAYATARVTATQRLTAVSNGVASLRTIGYGA